MEASAMLMNIAGTEWIIIILLGLVLLFGTKRLPQFSRSIGRALGEFEKAKNTFRREMEEAAEPARSASRMPKITGPVASEREKLETIANSLGLDDYAGLTDEQLRMLITKKMTS
ncbi:MAG TPA: twin-arginine translocase TatA/TatE family subunit [Nitrososphaera sp.]|jgi:sec-independent protein translocase protein TatA